MNEELTKDENDLTPTADRAVAKPKNLKLIIICCTLAAVIAVAFLLLYESEFDRVKNECVKIAGSISNPRDDCFTIDTYPDWYKNMEIPYGLVNAQEKALKGIKYANEEFGFNSSLYSEMLETNALMGRQRMENDKYRVSWTYHPDDGLEVTYEKK